MAKKLSIYLYGEIGFGACSASAVAKQLDDAKDAEEITVRINSPGGLVADGMAIHNLLAQADGKVTCLVDGEACSAASVILQAGADRVVAENAMVMIHEASGGTNGSSEDLTIAAEALKSMNANMARIYSKRSGKGEDEIAEMMKSDKWLTADKAVELGLADRVGEPNRAAAVVQMVVGLTAKRMKVTANVHEAFARTMARLTDEMSVDDAMSILYEEIDKEKLREVVKEVVEEGGDMQTTEASAAAKPAKAMEDMPPDEEDKPKGADGGEEAPPDVSADGLLDRLAEATGADRAAVLATLIDKLDDVAKIVNDALDQDGTPAESRNRVTSETKLRVLTGALATAKSEIDALKKKVSAFEKNDEARVVEAFRAEAQKWVDGGNIDRKDMDDAVAWLRSDAEAARRVLGASKRSPVGDLQAGHEPPAGAKPAAKAQRLEDLDDKTRRQARQLIAGSYGTEQECIAKAIELTTAEAN